LQSSGYGDVSSYVAEADAAWREVDSHLLFLAEGFGFDLPLRGMLFENDGLRARGFCAVLVGRVEGQC
jgi:hypothetical protein